MAGISSQKGFHDVNLADVDGVTEETITDLLNEIETYRANQSAAKAYARAVKAIKSAAPEVSAPTRFRIADDVYLECVVGTRREYTVPEKTMVTRRIRLFETT